ncbi:MAG: hypothetical protein K6E30_05475 [Lachnospiraceae bacterium]|nr:hypothetical protein [Lachnospiraceae bacterium]
MSEGIRISGNGACIEGKTFSGNLSARMTHPDGRPYHTFRTASLLADGDGIRFSNCVFENTAGPGKEVGQAIALYLDGDGIVLSDCRILGHQDTLFLAPLPPAPFEKDGFIGPKESAPRTPGKYLFYRCLIEGGVDFVFGGGQAVFFDCEFRSVEPGYVFAPSTPEGAEYGFVAVGCRFTCTENVPDRSCFIARPWREHARCRLIGCSLGRHIAPEKWKDWNKRAEMGTVFFEDEEGRFLPQPSR